MLTMNRVILTITKSHHLVELVNGKMQENVSMESPQVSNRVQDRFKNIDEYSQKRI